MPVSEDRSTFADLSRDDQIVRLEQIRTGWLNEQECYFEKETMRLSHRSAWCHLWANSFLIAGFVLAFAVVAGFQLHLAPQIATLAQVWGRYAVLHLSAVLFAGFACLQLLTEYSWKQPDSRNGDATPSTNSAIPSHRRKWLAVIRQLDETAKSWPAAFVLGIGMALAILSTVFGGNLPQEFFPAPNALTTFCKNVCFSMAGLLHASMAFSFLSQNIRRYSTMFGLYRGANQRMGRMLETLKQDRSPIESENTVRDIQNLLVDLGTEALNENSEWLQMHRTTPPAPIISAG